jgi:threonine/homoserine/homoserine lactone efflux protein
MSGMTPQLLSALSLFALVSSITPGPNNAMLLSSGVNFGLRASLPHMAGVLTGFMLLLLLVGLGLGGLFARYPVLHVVLAWLGAGYLLYLAARIALSDGISSKGAGVRPLRFAQAVAFQAVNPKGWAMSLGAMTAYAPIDHYFINVLVVVAVFAVFNGPCIFAWTAFGVALRRFLDRPKVLRGFNIAMAAVLVLSLVPALLELAHHPLQG